MSYIFLDESGDLGFDWNKSKTSNYFIITALFTVRKTNLDRFDMSYIDIIKSKIVQENSLFP